MFLPFEVWPQEGRSVRDLREGRERLLGNLECSEDGVKSVWGIGLNKIACESW